MADVVHAEVGGHPYDPAHIKKKLFIEVAKRGISPHGNLGKQVAEIATVTWVKLCKCCTYINHKKSTVVSTLIEHIGHDLRVSVR